jgi:hypothetical protein
MDSQSRRTRVIFDQRGLATFYDLGVDTSSGQRQWLTETDDGLRMAYPSGQAWGAVFITVGTPVQPTRPWKGFSAFSTLVVELRGENGGESLEIGIKDSTDPDNGRETKISVASIPRNWQTYRFPLKDFSTADLSRLYVVTEFVFSGPAGQTVYARNILYLP